MKRSLIFSLIFFSSFCFAETPICADKKPEDAAADILKAVKSSQLDETGCEPLDDQIKSKKDFADFVKNNSAGEKVIMTRDNPDKRTSNSVSYKFPSQPLAPGESIYLWVPSDLQKRGVDFVVLGHRQNPDTQTGTTPGEKWDKVPGLTSVTVYDKNRAPDERWRYWNGSASGKNGAKFAEVGKSFELEGLYEWSQLGHNSVKTSGGTQHDELKPTLVKITSVGQDTVELSELTLKTSMAESDSSKEAIFSPGTKFGNQKDGQGYDLKNGQKNEGLFPGAIPLKSFTEPAFDKAQLPSGWKLEKGKLIIPLEKGKILTNVEIAAGDAHPDKIRNEDGGYGTKGWSRMTVTQKSGMDSQVLMDHENVPPEGFLKAAPVKCGRPISDGEYLIIQADSDVSYLAGIKLNYRTP